MQEDAVRFVSLMVVFVCFFVFVVWLKYRHATKVTLIKSPPWQPPTPPIVQPPEDLDG